MAENKTEQLKKTVLALDNKSLAELRGYTKPPAGVKTVITASVLVLGDHEGKTKEWSKVLKLCKGLGENSLLKRIHDFNIENLHPEIAARGLAMLSEYTEERIRQISSGAATIYSWTKSICEERAGDAKPASLARQMEIIP